MLTSRIKRLRTILKEKNLDAFLISNFYNIFYLSGFKTLVNNEREAWLLVTTKNIYLFTDSRYINNKSNSNNKFLILKLITPEKGLLFYLKKIINQKKIKKLGFEGEDLKYKEFINIEKQLKEINLIATDRLIIYQRAIKDKEEIEKIKKACQIGDQCLSEIIKTIKAGQSEKEIAFKIETWLKEKGYDLAFYPIVAIDKNSSIPHYDTQNNFGRVKKNSVIVIDFGVKYDNYLSDITRTFFVGKPSSEIINFYNQLLLIQQKTINYLKKETSPKEIDKFCRRLITNFRLPIYSHSTGHGLGLEIHEYPKISQTSTDTLNKNQVFTIEPGIYMEGKYGIRIEDDILIKDDFQPETITSFTKKPIILF